MSTILYLPAVLILVGLLVGAVHAFRDGNPVLGGNAIASFGASSIPLLLEFIIHPLLDIGITIGPLIPLWIAIAGGLHTIGMTTIYERIWWWDHLTHTVSATFIGALVYGTLLVIDADPAGAELGWATIAGLTVAITFLAGLFWELIEVVGRDIAVLLDREPMLVPYGHRDTVLDLVFDLLGPIIIVLIDLRVFVGLAEQAPEQAESILTWATVVIFGGVVVLSVGLAWYHRDTLF